MTILANVLVNEPEKLDEDCREFLYRIGDQELWEQTYQEGNWNSAKWMGDDISNDVIEEVGAEKVLTYTWHAIQRSPYYSYRAVPKLYASTGSQSRLFFGVLPNLLTPTNISSRI